MTAVPVLHLNAIRSIPSGLLYPHQADGVAFLISKKRAILADDMGLGKTRQAILAVDISAFDDLDKFKARVDALVRDIRGSERMKGFERIYLPGEQSRERHAERSRLGVPIPAPLLSSLNQLGEKLGIGRLA